MFVVCLACSVASGVFCYFVVTGFSSKALMSVYLGLLTFIYSAILVADLYLIMRKAEVDDYIIAATIIYLDIIRLLVIMISAAGRSK